MANSSSGAGSGSIFDHSHLLNPSLNLHNNYISDLQPPSTCIPKQPRRRSSTKTNGSKHPTHAELQWTTSRAHRHLRQLISKITALKTFLQCAPSCAAAAARSKSGNTDPSFGGTRRTSGEHTSILQKLRVDEEYHPDPKYRPDPRFGRRGAIRKYGMNRTYSSNSTNGSNSSGTASSRSMGRTASSIAAATTTTQASQSQLQSTNLIANSQNGASSSQRTQPTSQTADKSNISNLPTAMLQTQKRHLNPTLFSLYMAIFQAMQQILVATAINTNPQKKTSRGADTGIAPDDTCRETETKGVPSLVALATRSLAKCILATAPSSEFSQFSAESINNPSRPSTSESIPSTEWYDNLADVSATYLPSLLRYHASEIVAQSIRTGALDVNLGSILAGQCFLFPGANGAHGEGEILVKAILEKDATAGVECIFVYVISPRQSKEFTGSGYRMLKEFVESNVAVDEANPAISAVHTMLKHKALIGMLLGGDSSTLTSSSSDLAFQGPSSDLDNIPEARALIRTLIELSFGIGGEIYRVDIYNRFVSHQRRLRAQAKNPAQAARATTRSHNDDIGGGSGFGSVFNTIAMAKKLRKEVFKNNSVGLGVSMGGKIHEVLLEILQVVGERLFVGGGRVGEVEEIVLGVVRGLVRQSEAMLSVIEGVWGASKVIGRWHGNRGVYPKETKVLVLLFGALVVEERAPASNTATVGPSLQEIQDCIASELEEEEALDVENRKRNDAEGHDAQQESFMQILVGLALEFFTSDEMRECGGGVKGVKRLVKVLLEEPSAFSRASHLTSAGPSFSIATSSSATLKKGSYNKSVAISQFETPNHKAQDSSSLTTPKNSTSTTTRYYTTRLALAIATAFVTHPENKYVKDIVEWAEDVETKVMGLGIPTPVKVKKASMGNGSTTTIGGQASCRASLSSDEARSAPGGGKWWEVTKKNSDNAGLGKAVQKTKKAYRWEEGVGAWVVVTGNTPWRKKANGLLRKRVLRAHSIVVPSVGGEGYAVCEDDVETSELSEVEGGVRGESTSADENEVHSDDKNDGDYYERPSQSSRQQQQKSPQKSQWKSPRKRAYIQPTSMSSLSSENEEDSNTDEGGGQEDRSSSVYTPAPPPPRGSNRHSTLIPPSPAQAGVHSRSRRSLNGNNGTNTPLQTTSTRTTRTSLHITPRKNYLINSDSSDCSEDDGIGEGGTHQTPDTSFYETPPLSPTSRKRTGGVVAAAENLGKHRSRERGVVELEDMLPTSSPIGEDEKFSGRVTRGAVATRLFGMGRRNGGGRATGGYDLERDTEKEEEKGDKEDEQIPSDSDKDDDYGVRRKTPLKRSKLAPPPGAAKKRKYSGEGDDEDEKDSDGDSTMDGDDEYDSDFSPVSRARGGGSGNQNKKSKISFETRTAKKAPLPKSKARSYSTTTKTRPNTNTHRAGVYSSPPSSVGGDGEQHHHHHDDDEDEEEGEAHARLRAGPRKKVVSYLEQEVEESEDELSQSINLITPLRVRQNPRPARDVAGIFTRGISRSRVEKKSAATPVRSSLRNGLRRSLDEGRVCYREE